MYFFLPGTIHRLFSTTNTTQTHVAREITYDDLAKFVQGTDKLEFLHEILPEKITVRQFRDILERGDEDSDSNSSGSEEESSISNDDDEEDDASDDEKEA